MPPNRPRVEYTEAGQKAADAFRNGVAEDNPRLRCETTSILFDWTFDGPVNRITQSADTITLQYGQLGLTRTIHMQAEHPANITPSRVGHSIGRWEDDVLVVDTIGFAPGMLSPPIMNSDQLHVVERFSLDPASMKITRSYTATDPVYYTDRVHGPGHDRRRGPAVRAGRVPGAHVQRLLGRRHGAGRSREHAVGGPGRARRRGSAAARGSPPPAQPAEPVQPAAPAKPWWKFWD